MKTKIKYDFLDIKDEASKFNIDQRKKEWVQRLAESYRNLCHYNKKIKEIEKEIEAFNNEMAH